MDYIIGDYCDYHEIRKILKKRKESLAFKDNFLFYSDSISDVYENILSETSLSNVIIRGRFNRIDDNDIKTCKENNIKLSIVVDGETGIVRMKKLMKKLLSLSIMFEYVLMNDCFNEPEFQNDIAKLINDKKIDVRISNSSLTINKFVLRTRKLQESLFNCGYNLLISSLDASPENKMMK